MTNEQLKQAAKDEAAREFGYDDGWDNAVQITNWSPKAAIDRAMEIYAEKVATVIADKMFKIANDLAIAGHGDYAVKLHGIHNELIKTTKP